MKLLGASILLLSTILFSNCTEQHDPTKDHEQLKAEHALAERPVAKLSPDGTLPKVGAGGSGGAVSEVDNKYNSICAACHGAAGDGNTPAGAALNPKPRDFTDAAWQAATSDERIATVIKDGGVAVGLSSNMAPWGAVLSDAQIKDMVGKVRSFKK